MSRIPVTIRSAALADAPTLALVWCDVIRRADPAQQVADLCSVIERAGGSDDECVAVAEYDGQVAGAVHLQVATLTPINVEPVVRAVSPHVLPQFRRHGVGSALMEAAVRFAEERGITHLASAATAESRDANRFMARLSLAPQAMLRVATTQTVRSKLSASRPAMSRATSRATSRQIDKVLAARRGLRREKVG